MLFLFWLNGWCVNVQMLTSYCVFYKCCVCFCSFCDHRYQCCVSLCLCVSSIQYVTFLSFFSGVPVKTEADPLAELQWASADQSATQRREGTVLHSQILRAPWTCLFLFCLPGFLWHIVSWLLSVCVSVWQRWFWQPGVQRGGRAQEKEDRGFESESVWKMKYLNTEQIT